MRETGGCTYESTVSDVELEADALDQGDELVSIDGFMQDRAVGEVRRPNFIA